MTNTTISTATATVRVGYDDLVDFTARVFTHRGVLPERARAAAEALCYGDLTGLTSHGLTNLTRLYLPLFDEERAVPEAEPRIVADRGAAVLLDGARALGLWVASEAMDLACQRAATYGVGLVSVRDATHFGCAGYHAARAAARDMIGIVAANCGRQRIARPPGGRAAMLGTNPLSVAAPGGDQPPFILDMSTTVVPTGRVRAAARRGEPIPAGWLEDAEGRPVTDPGALDRREGFLRWLGGDPATGGYKGYGLGLVVEILAAMLPGAGFGPAPAALDGDGGPTGRDDDIGLFVLAVDPAGLRSPKEFLADANGVFGTLQANPPLRPGEPVRYPGWWEAHRAAANRRDGVPLERPLHDELRTLAADLDLDFPEGERR